MDHRCLAHMIRKIVDDGYLVGTVVSCVYHNYDFYVPFDHKQSY